LFQTIARLKLDQPMNTPSESFSSVNYGLSSYHKAAAWMSLLEERLGTALFDSCMKQYYDTWKFKHPYPEDFKQIMSTVSGMQIEDLFALTEKKGSLNHPAKKALKLTSYFNLKETDQYQYISLAPAVGFNMYDGLQIGGLVHNYQLPLPRLQVLAAPLYATKSKTLNGIFRGSYNWYSYGNIQKFEVGAAGSAFSMDEFTRETGERLTMKFRKLAPYLRIDFRSHALSDSKKRLQLKWFFIKEDELNFTQQINGSDTTDVINLVPGSFNLGELKYSITNIRAIYPYDAVFNVQYHKDFIRATITGNYFHNYSGKKGGINIRWFAGKFFYTQSGDEFKSFDTERFHLNLTGARGYEDYTYSNYL